MFCDSCPSKSDSTRLPHAPGAVKRRTDDDVKILPPGPSSSGACQSKVIGLTRYFTNDLSDSLQATQISLLFVVFDKVFDV